MIGTPKPLPDLELCFVAEAGVLGRQALLLARSIRRFGGRNGNAQLTVISPRPERRPSSEIIGQLENLGADYHALNLSSPTPEYGPSFKVLALGWCARRSGAGILVQVDSDTVFLNEPDLGLDGHAAAARPVDVKGMCTSGPGDANEPFWERLCEVCGVEIDRLGFVESTVDNQRLRSSFNGGLIAARRESFERAEECFRLIADAGLRPFVGATHGIPTGSGIVSSLGFEMWGTSQAAMSIALAASERAVRILDPSYNFPLHFLDRLSSQQVRPIHLHYHWLFEEDHRKNPALDGRLPLKSDQLEWLKESLDHIRGSGG